MTPPTISGSLVAVFLALAASTSIAQHATAPTVVQADEGSGAAIFERACSACHLSQRAPDRADRAPNLQTLREFPPERIVDSLTSGKMQAQGAGLSPAERGGVAQWLAGRSIQLASAGGAPMANQCPQSSALATLADGNQWQPDISNSRFQSSQAAGLTAAQVPRLKVKWAFGFPNGAQVSSQPVIVGGWLFIGSDSGSIYALDANTGCVHWMTQAGAGVRTAPVVARLHGSSGPPTVFVGDLAGRMYALDAQSGRIVWSRQLDERPQIRVMAAPAISGGTLYVGVSSGEEGALLQADYECCRFRGSVSALDTATGRVLWRTYTVDEPTRFVDGTGTVRWAPSGGGVWSTPTLDLKRQRLYVTTGNAYTGQAGKLNDAVVALDLATGAVVWAYQDTADDVWLYGCQEGKPGCATPVGPDYDFASSAVLKALPNGREVLLAAHKGGVVVAIDPGRRGARIWRTNLSVKPPTFFGDILFGGAFDGTRGYFALQESAAITAVRLKDGSKAWSRPTSAIPARAERTGFGAAVTAIPGVVFSGGWDGVLHAFSADDGREIWSFDTVRAYDTVNAVVAKGGSMGGPGASIADGMLYVGSGYVGVSNGMPGNVLIAFAPE